MMGNITINIEYVHRVYLRTVSVKNGEIKNNGRYEAKLDFVAYDVLLSAVKLILDEE